MAEVIVVDSSSDDDVIEVFTPPRAPPAQWRNDALRDALAMVDAFQNEPTTASTAAAKASRARPVKPKATTTATPQRKRDKSSQKTKRTLLAKPPAKRSYGTMQRKDSWSSSASGSWSSSSSSSSSSLSPARTPTRAVQTSSNHRAETFRSPGIVTPEKPRERRKPETPVASSAPKPFVAVAATPPKYVAAVPPKPIATVPPKPVVVVPAKPVVPAVAAATARQPEIVVLSSSDSEEEVACESEEDVLLRSLGIPNEGLKKVAMKTVMVARQRKRLRRFDDPSAAAPEQQQREEQQSERVATPPVNRSVVAPTSRQPEPAVLPKARSEPVVTQHVHTPQKTKKQMKMKRKTPLNGFARKSNQKRLVLSAALQRKDRGTGIHLRSSDDDFESDESEMDELSSSQSSSEEEWPLPPARASKGASPAIPRKHVASNSSRDDHGSLSSPKVPKETMPSSRGSSGTPSRATATPERTSAMRKSVPSTASSSDADFVSARKSDVKKNSSLSATQTSLAQSNAGAAASQKRRRRKLEPHFNTDHIAFEEIQAQEAELARLRAEKAALDMHSAFGQKVVTASRGREEPPDLAAEMDLCSLSERDDSDSSIETADTKSVRSTDERSGTPSPGLALASVGKISPVKTPRKDPVQPKVVQPLPRRTGGRRQARKPAHPLRHVRATWQAPSVPVNLLPNVDRRPYEKMLLEPLSFFDRSGELEQVCAFLENFGQSQHLGSSYLLDASHQSASVSRDSAPQQVRSVLQKLLPVIRKCNVKRSNAVIEDTRSSVRALLRAQAVHRQDLVEAAQRATTSMERVWCRYEYKCEVSGDEVQPPSADVSASYCRGEGHVWEERIGCSAIVVAMPRIQSAGASVACITVRRNIRVDDDPILRFMPPPPDPATQSADPVTVTVTAAPSKETKSHGEFALAATAIDDEVAEFALRAVVARCGDSEHVFSALKTVAGFSQPYTDYSALKKLHDARNVAARRLADATKLIEDGTTKNGAAAARGIALLASSNALKLSELKNLRERLAPPPTFFDSNMVRWYRKESGKVTSTVSAELNVRPTDDYAALLESYRDLFCRICYCYDCQEHGIEQPQPTRRVDPTYPRLKSHATRLVEESEDESADSDGESEYESAGSVEMVDVATNSDDESDSGDSKRQRRSKRSITVQSTRATLSWRRQEQRRLKSAHQQQRASEAADVTEYVDYSHVELLSKPMARLLSNDGACSGSCWKTTPRVRLGGPRMQLDATVEVFVQKLIRLVGMNACVIAAMMETLSCAIVHEVLEEHRRRAREEEDWGDDRGERGRRSKKDSRSQSSRTSSNRELLKRSRAQRPVDHSANHAYEPCRHEGPCDSTACGCLKRDHTCEKACSCPRDCPNRFQGCRCSFGACRTVGCPCVAAGRECDPDLCTSCGAADLARSSYLVSCAVSSHGGRLFPRGSHQHGDPTLHFWGQSIGSTATNPSQSATCANVHLQRGAHRKIAIGTSDVHGLGAFAVGSIRRGDFITEYPGELISQDEAERRGLVYDQKVMSYLFDLNEDEVVDAIRKGNKSRFINHAPSQANCEAKIVRVGAEHRITIWARSDIRAGEELFFDYGTQARIGTSGDQSKSDCG